MAAPANNATQQQLPQRGWGGPWVKFAKLGVFALCVLVVLVLGKWAWNNSKREAPAPITAQNKSVQFVPVKHTETLPAAQEAPPPPKPVYLNPVTAVAPSAAAGAAPARNSTLFAYAAHNPAAEGAEAPRAHPGGETSGEQETAADDPLSASLRPANVGKVGKPHVMKEPRLIIPAGTPIPCQLNQRIITQLAGFVTCDTPKMVTGWDPTVMILPPGTRFFGHYKTVVTQGNDRIDILFTSGKTPVDRWGKGAIDLPINSPAVDELGSAGITGYLENHVGDKALALLLYTVLEAGPQIAQSALQNNNRGGNSYNTTTIAGPSQNVLGGWLQQKLQRPPTLIKNQGETIDIIAAQDWDLSCCIKLELR